MSSSTLASRYTLRFIKSIREVSAADWNSRVGEGYPFLRHEFLLAMEQSGCTTEETGWQPHHALVLDGLSPEQTPAAIVPLYLKNNSFGEYVFDWAWADAYYQHGLQYYPKFVTAAPFTPCAGPRICTLEQADRAAILDFLAEQLPQAARERGVSSWHILFSRERLSERLQDLGLAQRVGCQYQWFNRDFRDFEHFLEKFSSRKRKNIRKERRNIAEAGITFDVLEGGAVSPDLWRIFFRFYQSTYFVRGRQPYLNFDFFKLLGEYMAGNLLLVMARREEEYIAGALSFKDDNTLYGRYWGCTEEFQFLHFETCYYQGIDYCIRQGIQRFDSGAQGEHKIQRGFEPVKTYSNHWIADRRFEQAIANFLQEEEKYVNEHIVRATDFLPFRQE